MFPMSLWFPFVISFVCMCVYRWVMGCDGCRGKSHIFRLQVSNLWCRRLRFALRTRCFGLIYSQYVWIELLVASCCICVSWLRTAVDSCSIVTECRYLWRCNSQMSLYFHQGVALHRCYPTAIRRSYVNWVPLAEVAGVVCWSKDLASKHRWRFAPSWANSTAQCAGSCKKQHCGFSLVFFLIEGKVWHDTCLFENRIIMILNPVTRIDPCTDSGGRVQWIRTPSLANQEILQRPLMQQEIRKMLREESHVHCRSNETPIVFELL